MKAASHADVIRWCRGYWETYFSTLPEDPTPDWDGFLAILDVWKAVHGDYVPGRPWERTIQTYLVNTLNAGSGIHVRGLVWKYDLRALYTSATFFVNLTCKQVYLGGVHEMYR